jgi:light-independent protochlorophyllide reductase subunit B
MIERQQEARPPVTYTTFQARDLGSATPPSSSSTAAREAVERGTSPQAVLVGASCTAELIQDDPGGTRQGDEVSPCRSCRSSCRRIRSKESWGACRDVLSRLVRAFARAPDGDAPRPAPEGPSCNLLGPTALGFRHRDDIVEITRLLERLGVRVNVCAPMGARPADLVRIPEADFNVVMYPEIGRTTAQWLQRTFQQPWTRTVPIGFGATCDFVREVAELAGVDPAPVLDADGARLPWYSRSIDSTYLTGKRVFVFGDATHAIAAARIASEELGFKVCGLGTYSREFARDVREAAAKYGVEPLISDNHLDVEDAIIAAQPELVLGTQMERHAAKRLRLPCAVISSPVHVQDFPARYSPQMGYEGANVIFDSWVHPLMMGLEEHLLQMFRGDFRIP